MHGGGLLGHGHPRVDQAAEERVALAIYHGDLHNRATERGRFQVHNGPILALQQPGSPRACCLTIHLDLCSQRLVFGLPPASAAIAAYEVFPIVRRLWLLPTSQAGVPGNEGFLGPCQRVELRWCRLALLNRLALVIELAPVASMDGVVASIGPGAVSRFPLAKIPQCRTRQRLVGDWCSAGYSAGSGGQV